jgi:4-aminobutyrate aminotransferase/(S)-3-amino-2-methylpropionate transaminase
MFDKYETIGDVRGLGLMVGIELVKYRKTKKPASEEMDRILADCHRNGLVIIGAGAYRNFIRFLPPLNISEELLNERLEIFRKVISQ